ncbi:hypothetical protein PILCRDRAFT_98998 [Piloderma croceum F 1598]|uniref:DUF2470 domain-containing protein n=1 Tax=Piloderma croceum (strain F 1598) TaxID=765440 RepID=A0A0C3F5R8_PILCF|nr:hypothetical protein PILCRDRAFT_98998 [Piloderma croceum F 1598]
MCESIALSSLPVAQKSGFLKTYMSNHPDTLVAYAKYFGKVTDSISSAEMTAIDSNSMTLTYTVKNTKQKKVIQQVPLDPPLAGYEEVKPRLLGMKAEAQEGLGMVTAVVHILEGLYTLSLCKRHQTGFVVGTVYFLNTVIFGFLTWTDLRRQIQDARIESILKVE